MSATPAAPEPFSARAAEGSDAAAPGRLEARGPSVFEVLGLRRPAVPRKVLLFETLAVFSVLWMPPFLGSIWWRLEPQPISFVEAVGQLAYDLGAISLLVFLVWRNGEPLRVLGLRRTRWWKELLLAVLVFAGFGLGDLIAMALTKGLHLPWWESDSPTYLWTPLLTWTLPLFLLSSAFFEEILFRGYLWNRLVQLTGMPLRALVIASLLFAASHVYSPSGSLQVFTFGLIAGACYWAGKSVPRLSLAHWMWNVLVIYSERGGR